MLYEFFQKGIQTRSHGNSSQWKQAYDWGDHANSGYITGLIEDATPVLSEDLSINGNNIIGSGSIIISGDMTAISGYFDTISLDPNNESILTKGQISWDDIEGVLDMGLTDTLTAHIGEQRFYRIRNKTGGILYKGQVVYATGVHSNGIITPDKYVADNSIDEVRFIGVVMETVNNNNNGYVADFGQIRDLDLDGSISEYAVGDETWLAGDILYAHPTVAGKLTKVQPKYALIIAIILDVGNGNGNGRMFVRPTTYGDLDNNHDVKLNGVSHNDVLVYNSGTDYWENNNTVIFSDTGNMTEVTGINNIVSISQFGYDNLSIASGGPGYDPNTLYFVT